MRQLLHFLKGLGNNALILSCDSSLKPLLSRGIRPHLVTSIERIGGTELYYRGIEDFSGIYFAALPLLLPETIAEFKGRKFIAYRQYSHFNWLEVEKDDFKGTLKSLPNREELTMPIQEQLIVELYSK